jgi:hypothetical protein
VSHATRPSISCCLPLFVALGCGGGNGTDASPAPSGGNANAAGASGGSAAIGGSTGGPSGGSTFGGSGGSTTAGSSNAGSAGTPSAGSGGTDQEPPHEIGECDGLGALDEFQDITPPGVSLADIGITRVLADPIHAGTIYAGTNHQGLHKSTNCGADWEKVNTGTNGDKLDSGSLWSMAIDPIDPDVMYAGSLYGADNSLFKSTNAGVDWNSLFPPGSDVAETVEYNFFQDLSIDPTDHEHILTTFHAPCKAPYDPSCIAESTDAGATWRLLKDGRDGWTEGAGPHILGGGEWVIGTFQGGTYYTSNSGETWENVSPGMNLDMYRAVDGTYYVASDYGVQRSSDGHDWETVPGSPNSFGMMGDGERLFTSARTAGNGQPYYTSPENDGTTWTPLATPNMENGAVFTEYDADHHVMYFAATQSGLWRVVTK